MRRGNVLFSCVLATLVTLALACQQRQEDEDQGAPVDGVAETPGTAGTGQAATGGAADTGGGGDQAAVGQQVYEANCATCHGQNGGGDGPAGAGLQPPPANFTDSEWKYGGDLESVKKTIHTGVPGTAMIAWQGTLTEAEIEAVARHEIGFSQGGATASAP